MLENGAMVYKDQRRTNFSIPLNAVSNHFTIPKNTGISFRLPVVAVGDGDFPFRHSVTIPIQSEEGVLSIVDTFGVPWYSVTEEEKFGEVLSLECYIVF